MPLLYATIIIRAENEMYLHDVGIKRLMVSGINPQSRLQYVRNIRLRSSFYYHLEERCIHYRDIYKTQIDPEGGEANGFQKLTTDIMSLLEQLEDQSLRGFRSAAPLFILSGCSADR
jgi:hypothetical protein